ncbi:solute carrier family 35 member G1-like [Saccoglossus kowalevskii]|uniref:Solute carrier family 35 member G1-like n=1 Tax=Saccoglossus kowalevskii TaxID=10224 RepID=A0ABM0MGD2_SACKO|nr:PREDICTED: solute carrier family 35 member G1-like [Saccoglossus kowalevskii]
MTYNRPLFSALYAHSTLTITSEIMDSKEKSDASSCLSKLQVTTDEKDDKSKSQHRKAYFWTAVLGATLGLLSGALFAVSDSFALLCIKIGYSPTQVLLVKSLAMVVITVPCLIYKNINILKVKRKDTLLNIVKSLCENTGDLMYYYGMNAVGLGDATSIVVAALPIFAPLFACIFIKEKFKLHDCISIVLNIAGIILISRPEFIFGNVAQSSGIGYLYSIITGIGLSIGTVCSRAMSDGLSLLVLIFYNGFCGIILLMILVYPTSNERIYILIPDYPITIAYLVGVVVFFYLYLYSYNRALKILSAGKVTLLSNSCLIVGFVADVVVFHKQVVSLELIGAAIIILSSSILLLFIWLETRKTLNEETKLIKKPKKNQQPPNEIKIVGSKS